MEDFNTIALDESTLRENLKKARKSFDYTQSELAESIGISVTAYQKLEKGKTRILNKNFSECAEVLGVSLAELVNGFTPIKDAEARLADVKETYGLKMKVQESSYLDEIQAKDKEIERLKETIAEKDGTIFTQKYLIKQLVSKLET